MRDPDLRDPKRGFAVVARAVVEHVRLAFPRIEELYAPGETVAVGGTLAFAVRLAKEKLGLPAATVHLQPSIMYSNYETPAYPGFETPRWWPTLVPAALLQPDLLPRRRTAHPRS